MARYEFPSLLTDLYQLTMAEAYFRAGVSQRRAVFELFFRRPPHGGTLAVAAGIEPALDFLENLSLAEEDIEYLRSLGLFTEGLLRRLAGLRFTGDVDAVPEGTVVFSPEPILRVSSEILEAQLLETPLLNLIGFATLTATKAARIEMAAAPAEVMEFGCRRAQGPDGALTASRCAYIGGSSSTSNVEAGRRFGIPVRGTMAHSMVMAFPSELEAFRAYATAFPDSAVLLLDTYNTRESGLPHAITVARELRARGHGLAGVRLDSGNLAELSFGVRASLDTAGFEEVKIIASGDLDEISITALRSAGAPIDVYGVGTSLGTSLGDPALTCVYKLVAMEEGDTPGVLRARTKSTDDPQKATLPGPKQVYRRLDRSGQARGDLLALWEGDEPAGSVKDGLLLPAFRSGRRVVARARLPEIRKRARASLETIPLPHRQLENPRTYPVELSPGLQRLMAKKE